MFSAEKLKLFGFLGDIDSSYETREANSIDASLFKVPPEVVVFPKNVSDICALVAYVNDARIHGDATMSLTCRSAGTDMSGGPLTDSIVVSMTKYFNKIVNITDDTCTVQPGVYFRDLEKSLAEKGLMYASYPASKDLCTIGGIVANNSAGEKTLSLGQTLDYVKEIKMVCTDGKEHTFRPMSYEALDRKKGNRDFEASVLTSIHALLTENADTIKRARPKVSKNSSGYFLWRVEDTDKRVFDLPKLITGSQGTLGIITEVTLKVLQPQPYSSLVVTFLNTLDDVPVLVQTLLKHHPESIESYDDHTFKIAVKFLPQIFKRMGGSVFTLGLKFLPEVWMAITGGIPKLVVLAEFTGTNSDDVEARAVRAEFDLRSKGFTSRNIKSDAEAKKYWTFRRESFNLLRSKVKGMRTACFVDDIVVDPRHLPEFLPKIYEILDSYKFLYTIAGHVGDGNFHIIPLVARGNANLGATVEKAMEDVFSVVFKYKGSMSGEHNDGLIRTHLLPKMYGEQMVQLFNKVKDTFDPQNIFNPRKKAHPDKEWAFKHVDY